MKNYIVTFTNNSIYEDCLRQQEALRESLGPNNTFISQINEEISFETIDREVENALFEGYDNFICLAEDEDVTLLQEGLDEEYGDKFREILVIPEAFGRIYEDEGQAPKPPVEDNTPLGILFKNHRAMLQNVARQLNDNRNVDEIISEDYNDLLNKYQNTSPAVLAVFKLICLGIHNLKSLTFGNKANGESYSNLRLLNNTILSNPNGLIDMSHGLTIEACKAFLYENGKEKEFLATYRKGANYTTKNVKLSANGEVFLSTATSFLIYAVSTSYPFTDVMNSLYRDVSNRSRIYGPKGLELKFMMCGPYSGQQFLPSASICEIAKRIPDANLENVIKSSGLDNPGALHAGFLTEDQLITSLQTLSTIAPNVQSVVLVVPKNTQLRKLMKGSRIKALNGNIITILGIEEGIQQWSAVRNTPVFNSLNELISTEANNFKGCKKNPQVKATVDDDYDELSLDSHENDSIVADNTKDELSDEDEGHKENETDEFELNDLKKKAARRSKKYKKVEREIETGWPTFVKALMEATSQYLKEKIEKTTTPGEFDKKKSYIVGQIQQSIKTDYDKWHSAMETVGGIGDIINVVNDSILDKFKKSEKDTKDLKKILALISTANYKLIKEAFGGKFEAEELVEQDEIEEN